MYVCVCMCVYGMIIIYNHLTLYTLSHQYTYTHTHTNTQTGYEMWPSTCQREGAAALDPDYPYHTQRRLTAVDERQDALLLERIWRYVYIHTHTHTHTHTHRHFPLATYKKKRYPPSQPPTQIYTHSNTHTHSFLRAGQLEEAIELCKRCGQHWRAASISGGDPWDVFPSPEEEEETHTHTHTHTHTQTPTQPKKWVNNLRPLLWRRMCVRLAETLWKQHPNTNDKSVKMERVCVCVCRCVYVCVCE
jgi:hypothetical protein